MIAAENKKRRGRSFVFIPMGKQAPTEQALFARLQRQLIPQGQQLHRCRLESRDLPALGRYYVTEPGINAVVATDINLASWLEGVA